MSEGQSSVFELARQLLQAGARERLNAPLDVLVQGTHDAAFGELLLAAHSAGVANTLRELLEGDALDRWVAETCTAREEEAMVRGLSGWLGQSGGSEDDPETGVRLPELPTGRGALQAWARAQGVQRELERPAQDALKGFELDARLSLLDACEGAGDPVQRGGSLLQSSEVPAAARAHLWRSAASVQAAAQRARRWAGPLPEGALRLLGERLRALLLDISPSDLSVLRFVPAHPVRVDVDRGLCSATLRDTREDTVVAVRLPLGGHEQRGLEGRCKACADTHSCLHVRALAARLLDALLDRNDRLHADLTRVAAEPSWKRFVRALGDGSTDASRIDEKQRVAFRLDPAGLSLRLTAVLQKRGSGGKWSVGRARGPHALLQHAACSDQDRHALEAMKLGQRTLGTAPLSADLGMLRALVEHPRVHLEGDAMARPLRVTEQMLQVDFEPQPGGVVPKVRLAGGPLPAGAARSALGYAYVLSRSTDTLCFGPVHPALRRLLAALSDFAGVLPPESYASLGPRIAKLRHVARVNVPEALRGSERAVPRRLLLRITPGLDQGIDIALTMRPLPLGGLWSPGVGPQLVHGLIDGVPVFARRDLDWERVTAASLLEALGASELMRLEAFRYRIDETQGALSLLSIAARRTDVLDLEWSERSRAMRVQGVVHTRDLKVKLFKRGDWLQLGGAAKTRGGEVAVERLLEAARRGERFVSIAGRDYVEIEEALFERLQRAQLCLDLRAHAARLSRAALPRVLVELGDGLEAEQDVKAWVAAAAGHEMPRLAERWLGCLRGYQQEGVRWLLALSAWAPGACLADEMGLGKTVQAIALLTARAGLGPALVVAPTSVVHGWQAEIARFAPELQVSVLEGAAAVPTCSPPGAGEVWVVSYDRLLRDRESLSAYPFATQVLDEAQVIKNARTQRARAAREVQAAFRLALTGTPVENRLGDLWSLFHLVAPGLLGGWERFRARFAVPIERYGDAERAEALRALVTPLLLRRLKRDVAKELPTRTETVQLVELSEAERALYDASHQRARRALARRARDRTETLAVLAELTRLRQLACHPRLVLEDPSAGSSKLAALLRLLDDILPRGHRALIFSQFTRHLALVQEAIDARALSYQYLDGSTPSAERARRIAAFQAGEGQVFLISLKAGGTGLNLTAADYVIHMDPWWNPAAEDQASDRAHRIGQSRPVTVVKLVAEGTIEERVLSLHAHKRALADSVLGEGSQPSASQLDEIFDTVL